MNPLSLEHVLGCPSTLWRSQLRARLGEQENLLRVRVLLCKNIEVQVKGKGKQKPEEVGGEGAGPRGRGGRKPRPEVCKFREGNLQALHSGPDLASPTWRVQVRERLQGCTPPATRVAATSVVPRPQSPSLCSLLRLGPPRLPEQPPPTPPTFWGSCSKPQAQLSLHFWHSGCLDRAPSPAR